MTAAPLPAPPDFLFGPEGETVFVRCGRDFAATPAQARERALAEGCNVAGMEVDVVEMLPVPEHFTGIGMEWATVRERTPGAVSFWRFTF